MATATGAPVGTTYAPGTMPATGGAVAVPVGTTAAPVQPVKKHPIRHLIRWLGWLILACHVLATFIPWYQIRKFSRPGGHGWGHINLTDYRACTHDDSVATPELSPSEACTLVPLRHAPGYLNYIYRAGSVALAFLIASIVLDLLALYLLHRSARQTHMLRALLTNKIMLPLLYLLLFIFSVLAWASWVGLFKNKFDAQSLALTSGSLSSPDHGYSGGFALTVIASILSLINAILCFLFLRRLFHHNTANAATAAPTTAGAHTVPPAVY